MRELLAQAGIPAGAAIPLAGLPRVPSGSARRLPARAQSALVCLFPYLPAERVRGNLALYAALPDYHRVAGAMLKTLGAGLRRRFPEAAFAPFCDVSPLNEVAAAVAAGLGERGENGMLLTDRWGPYVFIGELVSDLPPEALSLPPDPPPALCRHCGACLSACPTGACGTQEKRGRCLSALSQKKGALSQWEQDALRAGGLVWGCDRCMDACPLAKTAQPTPICAFGRDIVPSLTAENLAKLVPERAFGWRGEAVLRRNLEIFMP